MHGVTMEISYFHCKVVNSQTILWNSHSGVTMTMTYICWEGFPIA